MVSELFENQVHFIQYFTLQRQLIHFDGSASDTTIEVKLRHPGKNDRNIVSVLKVILL